MTDAASKNKRSANSGAAHSTLRATPEESCAAQPVDTLLAMCLFGEARGESEEARRAIAQVILNRARHPHKVFGSRAGAGLEENLRRVILKPQQFSCFLESDPNYPKILHPLDYEPPAVWQRCLDAAQQALATAGEPDALTLNSDHYFDDSLQPPSWADPAKQTVLIGRLRFYRLYLPTPTAGAGFLLHTAGDDPTSPRRIATGDAAASPSRRESSPPEPSRRADATLLRASAGDHSARHRREASGSGPHTSTPVPHHPSQRTPRLGSNRWFQRSRGLSSLCSGFATRHSGITSAAAQRGWLLMIVLLSVSLTSCTELEQKAYQSLVRSEVEYEAVRGRVVEAVVHGLLDDQQMDRYIAASHSFLAAHDAAVEALAAFTDTGSDNDRARLRAALDLLPGLIRELHDLMAEFDRHPAPRQERSQKPGVRSQNGKS
ncbi:MAG: cell wall hydrolase [Acidobacteria bacterium]|nr:cell wall hydrolase [Acidobacteriota bacterium]